MKEESPCAVNALRTALRVYNKHRIIDTGAIKTNLQAVERTTINNSPSSTFPAAQLSIRNTHYCVLFCCLHRHLEQSRTGCLLSEQRQPCLPAGGAWCVSVVALTQDISVSVPAPVPGSPRLTGPATERLSTPVLSGKGGYPLTYAL